MTEKGTTSFEVDVNGWPEPKIVFILKVRERVVEWRDQQNLQGRELKNGEGGVEIVGHDGFFKVRLL